MAKKHLNVVDSMALSFLLGQKRTSSGIEPPPGTWVRIVRSYLRMTQKELARRTKIPQPYLADIETGKVDIRFSTLGRIFQAMHCRLSVRPEPIGRFEEVLRGRARAVALKRLKQSMGTMSLEGQAPDKEMFRQLLEKKTDEILEDKRERLSVDDNE